MGSDVFGALIFFADAEGKKTWKIVIYCHSKWTLQGVKQFYNRRTETTIGRLGTDVSQTLNSSLVLSRFQNKVTCQFLCSQVSEIICLHSLSIGQRASMVIYKSLLSHFSFLPLEVDALASLAELVRVGDAFLNHRFAHVPARNTVLLREQTSQRTHGTHTLQQRTNERNNEQNY